MHLPDRSLEAEDAYVGEWAARSDRDGLFEAIEAAMADHRPRLAARLVNLLDDDVDIEPGSPIERARRAARMVLVDDLNKTVVDEDESFAEFADAWAVLVRRRIERARRRHRRHVGGSYDPDRHRGRRR